MFTRLTTNQKLAAVAFVLGAIALFAQPQQGHAVRISPKDLAVIVETDADQVAAPDLARWIIEGRSDFRLIDLRDDRAYAEYHIPGAEHVALTALPDLPSEPTEKVVVYADGATQSAQAWFLMKARGAKNAYLLRGGFESWKREVLYPTLATDSNAEQRTRNEELSRVAAHFGGQAAAAGAAAAATVPVPPPALPRVQVPAAPAGGQAATPRKRKEGC